MEKNKDGNINGKMCNSKKTNWGGNLKEIWSNPNPQTSFSSTTINVPISDLMLVEFCKDTGQINKRCTFLLNANRTNFAIPNDSNDNAATRTAERKEDGIYFGDGYNFSTYPYVRKDNSHMIPYKIYTL